MENNFQGISTEALALLFEIRLHDSQSFFEDKKSEYRKLAVEPFKALVAYISPTVLQIDPGMQVTPAIGKTISRLRRDTRFSRDKSLYRDTMWFFLRRQGCSWLDAPGFWFEVKQDCYAYGVGMFCALPKIMELYREIILRDQKAFLRLIRKVDRLEGFVAEGESYKRDKSPQGMLPEISQWFNKKEIFISHRSDNFQRLASPQLAEDIREAFEKLAPFYRFAMEVFDEYNIKNNGIV